MFLCTNSVKFGDKALFTGPSFEILINNLSTYLTTITELTQTLIYIVQLQNNYTRVTKNDSACSVFSTPTLSPK